VSTNYIFSYYSFVTLQKAIILLFLDLGLTLTLILTFRILCNEVVVIHFCFFSFALALLNTKKVPTFSAECWNFFCFQVQGFRFQVSGFRFQVQGFRFKVQGFRFQVSSFRFQVSGSRFQVPNSKLKAQSS
jgi:hypothetical protein